MNLEKLNSIQLIDELDSVLQEVWKRHFEYKWKLHSSVSKYAKQAEWIYFS